MFEKETGAALAQSTIALQSAIKFETPVGAGPAHLRDSILYNPVRGGLANMHGEVYTSQLYGECVENGTKPHWPPGIKPGETIEESPIGFWASRKLGLAGKDLNRAVYFIRKKIAEKGTVGAQMFAKGWDKCESTINNYFTQAADNIRDFLLGR